MKKVYLSNKPRKTLRLQKSRLQMLKENRLKKVSGNTKINRKKLKKKLIKIGIIFAGIILIVSTVGGLLVLAYLQDKNDEIPTPDKVFPELPITSEIYDRKALEEDQTGTRLYRVIGQFNSDQVNIAEVPDHVKLAFIAAEDKDFYIHGGFDPAALIRCGVQYVRNSNESCGGSTITQQLVKLTTQRSERALERKVEEILIAIKVEQSYDKDRILEMYLRVTPFGSSIVGIKTAANFYFGKEPKDLTLAEAATLAAIIQNPPYLSPTVPIDGDIEASQAKVKERQLYVLDQLEKNAKKFNDDLRKYYDDPERDDVITSELIEEALNEDWQSKLRPPVATDKKAGHFVNYVINLLQTRNYKNGQEPFTLTDLQTGGYKIYTTLDYSIQQIAERYVQRAGNDYSYWNVHNAALMTTIPGTGEIISMAGSKSFYGQKEECDANQQNCKYDPEVNVLTSLQEPGSSNKPMGYYLAYKEGKLFTGSFLPDIPIQLVSGGVNYTIRNWDGQYKGINYTAEQALRDSRNLPASTVIQMIGVENYTATARQWGYTSYPDDSQVGISAILGGVSVYPIEHAQAYGVFANGGDFVQLNPILKIVDKNGNTVYEASVEKKNVADPQGIFLLNQSVKNYDGYSWDGRDMGGKTGTTNENWDAWFMGYSPDFVNVCWAGNNNNSPMDPNNGYPPIIIKPWCQDYLREIGESPYLAAKTPFTRPGGVYEGGGDCNADGCLGLARGWLIEGRNPPRDVKRAKARVCTDQQDRLARPVDIALGLSFRKDFSQYLMPVPEWQVYLDQYMGQKNTEKPGEFAKNGIPTEYCDKDRSGGVEGPYFPTLTASVTGSSINIKGSVFSNQGNINALSFAVRNQTGPVMNIPSCTTDKYNGYDITCDLSTLGVDSGNVTLIASASDTGGESNNKEITISVPSGFSFTAPSVNPCYISGGSCPSSVSATFGGGWTLTSVTLYVSFEGGSDTVVGPMSASGNNYSRNWSPLVPGSYRFRIVANTSAGGTLTSGYSEVLTVNP